MKRFILLLFVFFTFLFPFNVLSENWVSAFKDGCNSQTTEAINFPLVEKWKISIPIGISNVPKLLYYNGKVVVCYTNRAMYKPFQQALAYDVEGNKLWDAIYFYRYGIQLRPKKIGDGKSRGRYVIDQNGHLWIGVGHNGNVVVDIETGIMIPRFGTVDKNTCDWASGIKESWSQVDENFAYAYGAGGVDSTKIQVIANDLNTYSKKWGKSNSMQITGLTSNGMGQPASRGGILYVPDGILWAYSTIDGSVVWQKGRWPKQEAVGEVCHYGNVVINNDRLFVLGRECITLHQGIWGESGFIWPTYSIPRLYEYDLNGNYKSHIDLSLTPNLFLYQERFLPFSYIITDNKIIISSLNGVTIYSRVTHELLYFVQFSPLWVVPRDCYGIVLAGNILFMENGKEIRALTIDTLQEVWQWNYISFLSTYISSMIPIEGKLFITTTNNELFCLGQQ